MCKPHETHKICKLSRQGNSENDSPQTSDAPTNPLDWETISFLKTWKHGVLCLNQKLQQS